MILANGTVYDTARQGDILGVLEDQINATLASLRLEAETVVAAIHTLGERLAAGAFAPLLARLELDGTERYMEQLIPMLRREALEYKLQVELGRDAASYSTKPPGKLPPLTVQPAPRRQAHGVGPQAELCLPLGKAGSGGGLDGPGEAHHVHQAAPVFFLTDHLSGY